MRCHRATTTGTAFPHPATRRTGKAGRKGPAGEAPGGREAHSHWGGEAAGSGQRVPRGKPVTRRRAAAAAEKETRRTGGEGVGVAGHGSMSSGQGDRARFRRKSNLRCAALAPQGNGTALIGARQAEDGRRRASRDDATAALSIARAAG